jgi:hypothetical protein
MDPYDLFFGRYPDEVQAIGRKLRAMVKRTLPGAHEVLVDRHNHIAYHVTEAPSSMFAYICPLPAYVRLGFMYGSHLDDPAQLLVGEGKRLRHVKVWSVKAAGHPALKSLVAAAWAEAQTHLAPRPAAKKAAARKEQR